MSLLTIFAAPIGYCWNTDLNVTRPAHNRSAKENITYIHVFLEFSQALIYKKTWFELNNNWTLQGMFHVDLENLRKYGQIYG